MRTSFLSSPAKLRKCDESFCAGVAFIERETINRLPFPQLCGRSLSRHHNRMENGQQGNLAREEMGHTTQEYEQEDRI